MTIAMPMIRQKPFFQLVTALDEMGVNVTRRFSQFGIPAWQYGDDEDLIPLADFVKVFDVAAGIAGSDLIGRMVAERIDVADLGAFGRSVASSLTVFDGMQTACELVPKEVTTLRFWLEPHEDGYLFCRKQLYSKPDIEHALHVLEQYTLALLTQIVRLGAGPQWQPSAMCMSIAQGNISTKWADRFDTRVHFETPFSAIFVPASVLSEPLPPLPAPAKLKQQRRKWDETTAQLDLVPAIRELLSSFIRIGEQDRIRLEAIAEVSGLSARTLQRRLAADGKSFHKLLDQARYMVAMDLMTDPDVRIADLAEFAGYENPQHFIRAFKRWTGMTPGAYRKMTLATQ